MGIQSRDSAGPGATAMWGSPTQTRGTDGAASQERFEGKLSDNAKIPQIIPAEKLHGSYSRWFMEQKAAVSSREPRRSSADTTDQERHVRKITQAKGERKQLKSQGMAVRWDGGRDSPRLRHRYSCDIVGHVPISAQREGMGRGEGPRQALTGPAEALPEGQTALLRGAHACGLCEVWRRIL